MKFIFPIVEARLVRREKRFLTYCRMPEGEVIAHCPNPGSMKGNLEPNSPVWLMDFGPRHLAEGRKLRYKWVMVESLGTRVVIDTNCANAVVAEALKLGKIRGFPPEFKAEHKVGASRLDFYFPSVNAYLEVKSVSMGDRESSAFPDSVTERGQKHLRELMALRKSGARAILFFLVTREGSLRVRVAKEIDPTYAALLAEAVAAGVEVLVYGTKIGPEGIEVGEEGELA
jgi:sugar fermentation stimulation protein A